MVYFVKKYMYIYSLIKNLYFLGLQSRASLSVIAVGGRHMPTAFAPLYFVSVWKIKIRQGGGGVCILHNASRGLISWDIAFLLLERNSPLKS